MEDITIMYVQLDKNNRCVSMCSEKQNENDIEMGEYTEDFIGDLQKYVYQDGEFIKDEDYKIVTPKSQIEILQETVDMLILDNLGVAVDV